MSVRAALDLLRPRVVRTPLLESPLLNELVSSRRGVRRARIFVKAESLQHTGAFKFRGALHKLLSMDEETRARGVCAFSSGNFAQALALAAQKTGVACTIIAPHDAPEIKMERTRGYGAQVVFSTPSAGENREVAAARLAEQYSIDAGCTLLHPFDDHDVILGQGTLALELFEQFDAMVDPAISAVAGDHASPPHLKRLLVPTGGGGMASGCCLARDVASPRTEVWAIEPAGYDDHKTSLARGERTPLTGMPASTICDALQASAPGHLTFAITGGANGLAGAVALSDDAVKEAMSVAFDALKLVLEPSGALGIAAMLSEETPLANDDCVAVVACGGNVALADFRRLLA